MVDPNDYLEQKKVYTYRGKGKWIILGYMSTPSLTMINVDDRRRIHFPIRSLTDNDFSEISNEEGLDIGSPTDGQ